MANTGLPHSCWTTVAILLAVLSTQVNGIRFEKGGYKDVRVAIHDAVPEDHRIIENLQILFTNASELLYNATRGQAYFREVVIIVPKNWTLHGRNFTSLFGASHFQQANIRVDKPNPMHGNEPYTLQPGQCGEPGQYIHFTPRYLLNVTHWPSPFERMPERQLVHEWAHLRYGIFDEYGTPDDTEYPMFYMKNGKIHPQTCIHGIPGFIGSANGGPCTVAYGEVQSDCRFLPDVRNATVKASVMSYHYIPSVEYFCDDDHPDRLHNKDAPSKHNAMCDYMSTWSVITSHEDFAQIKRWPKTAVNRIDTRPVFILKRIDDQAARIVLVLDKSSSMSNERRIDYLKESTTRLLRDRVPNGTFVGIVTFNAQAQAVTKGLVHIINNSSRESLVTTINGLTPGGYTNIEDGLRKGLQMLQDGPGKTAEGGLIILVSDGEENRGNVDNVFPDIVESKVTINTIAFGASASDKLEMIVNMTGGISHFFNTRLQTPSPPSEVDNAFVSAITMQADVSAQKVNIVKTRKTLHPSQQSIRHSFLVDNDLGKDTTVMIVSDHVKYLSVSLIDPFGNETYGPNSGSDVYSVDEKGKRILVRIGQASPGNWAIVLNSSATVAVELDIEVQSEAVDPSSEPIRVRSWVSSPVASFASFNRRTILRIFAEVKKGYNAVVDAMVIATVEMPNGQAKDVTLKDDGRGADVTRNDGIYSAFFPIFPAKGRYVVSARVVNDGKARIRLGSKSSGAIPLPDIQVLEELSRLNNPSVSFDLAEFNIGERRELDSTEEEDVFPAKEAEKFERSVSTGGFKVDDTWSDDLATKIPPNKVTDLSVLSTHMAGEYLTAILRWTSPGDDMDFGNASWIELRGSSVVTDLSEDKFAIAYQFTNIPDLENPLPSGSLQELNVTIPFDLVEDQLVNSTDDGSGVLEVVVDFHFALRGHDKDNNVGEVSNIASAHFSEIWDIPREAKTLTTTAATTIETTTAATTIETTTVPEGETTSIAEGTTVSPVEKDDKPWVMVVVWVCVGIVAVAVLVILVGFVMMLRKRRMSKTLV